MSNQQYQSNTDEQANSAKTGFYLNTWGFAWRILGIIALGIIAMLHVNYVDHLIQEGVFEPEFGQTVGFLFITLMMFAFMIMGGEITNALRRWFVDKTGESRVIYGSLVAITAIGLYVYGTPIPDTGKYAEALEAIWRAASIVVALGWLDGAIYPEDKKQLRQKLRAMRD